MAIFRKPKATKRGAGEKSPQPSRKFPGLSSSSKRKKIAYRVLRQPHVTEKGGRVAENNQYAFRVSPHATKNEISQAVFDAYGVRPTRVNTSRVPRKRRRLGTMQGWISGYKKAIVTLPKGKTIEVLPR